jgi:L-lysine 6-transaminase
MADIKTDETSKTLTNGFDPVNISPKHVSSVLSKYILADGYDLTLDIKRSKGVYLYDSKHDREFLDFFTFFASSPLGMNHPKIDNEEFKEKVGEIAITKPSLSDIYVQEQAEFVETFFRIAVPKEFKYSFYIEGGALAIENALKAAFDWNVRKNFARGYTEEKGHQVIHFQQAFHGRSGYTMSLTNTDPDKTALFPKFKWPRIINPKVTYPLSGDNLENVIRTEEEAVNQIKEALANNKDDIAALIIEPIQGEGGDNHFRKEFFIKLRELCDENEMLLIFDEIQTGIALTGKWWAHQYYVTPDIMCFGKKTQVCGLVCTDRIDEVEDNVFRKSSRINSTWGGNLVDMFRFRRILEIIEEDNLVENCNVVGKHLQGKIQELSEAHKNKIFNPRGLGLFCAFDCASKELRNQIVDNAFDNNLIILGCGERAIRFRTPLCINEKEIDAGMNILDKAVGSANL